MTRGGGVCLQALILHTTSQTFTLSQEGGSLDQVTCMQRSVWDSGASFDLTKDHETPSQHALARWPSIVEHGTWESDAHTCVHIGLAITPPIVTT